MFLDARIPRTALLLPLLALHIPAVQAALQHRPPSSLPHDIYGTPKYQIRFLDSIGVEEAQRWIDGIEQVDDSTTTKGEIALSLDQHKGETDQETEHAITWSSLFSGNHAWSGIARSDKNLIWFDRQVRARYDLDTADYPQIVSLKLARNPPNQERYPVMLYPNNSTYTGNLDFDSAASYLCALPAAQTTIHKMDRLVDHKKESPKPAEIPDAMTVYRQLDPLSNDCIYHRQGWFTYKYCHNSVVRQFRESTTELGTRVSAPVEDEEFEAYDLGLSPLVWETKLEDWKAGIEEVEQQFPDGTLLIPDPDHPEQKIEALVSIDPAWKDLVSELEGVMAKKHDKDQSGVVDETERWVQQSLSIRSNIHARYLVQSWEAGTPCDMNGKARRIEIEFHCNPDEIDQIVGVKEISTCQYIMTINTPRICTMPGFFVPSSSHGPLNGIRCREIVYSSEEPSAFASEAQPDDSEFNPPRDYQFPTSWPQTRVFTAPQTKKAEPYRPPKLRKLPEPLKGSARQYTTASKSLKKTAKEHFENDIKRAFNEDWEGQLFVRFARYTGFYKKGEKREEKHKAFIYKTVYDAIESDPEEAQAEEDRQRQRLMGI